MSPSITVTLKDSDHGWEKLMEMGHRIAHEQPYAKAGVMGLKNSRRGDPIDNVSLAVIHEFGAPSAGIPERSFVRSAFDRNLEKYSGMVTTLVGAIYEGKTTEKKALGLLGLTLATDIKLGITAIGITPPDSPATLRRKARKGGSGSPRTLVDTGQLVGAVSWEVVAGGAKEEGGAPE